MTSTVTTSDATTAASGDVALPGLGLRALIDEIFAETTPIFAAMEWAEEEIAAAQRRHPHQADAIWHTFKILTPRDIGPGMGPEFVYRGFARELLDRVAAGADLRPATAAEVLLVLVDTSLQAPMHGPGAGLYFRMWQKAFPDHPMTVVHAEHQVHYERLHGDQIDQFEADLRHRLRDPDRQIGDIDCCGRHNGEPVNCAFAAR
jgi:hypothetical protein